MPLTWRFGQEIGADFRPSLMFFTLAALRFFYSCMSFCMLLCLLALRLQGHIVHVSFQVFRGGLAPAAHRAASWGATAFLYFFLLVFFQVGFRLSYQCFLDLKGTSSPFVHALFLTLTLSLI